MTAFLWSCVFEFFAAAVIAGGVAVASMKTWPTDTWQYVVLGFGMAGAGIKAIYAYKKEPK